MVLLLILTLAAAEDYTSIPVGSTTRSVQNSEWSFFELENEDDLSQSGTLRIVLEYSSASHVDLVLSINTYSEPRFSSSKSAVDAEFVDYNAWKHSRAKHTLTFPASYLSTPGPIIIGVGSADETIEETSFTLTTEYSIFSLCPNDCSGKGYCNHYTCECYEGFIDYDCSTSAFVIDDDHSHSFTIENDGSLYIYFLTEDRDDVLLEFTYNGPDSQVFMDWSGNMNVELPVTSEFSIRTQLEAPEGNKKLELDIKDIHYKKFYILVMNNSPISINSLYFTIKVENIDDSESLNIVMYVLIGICGFVVLIWIASCFIRIYYTRANIRRNQIRHHEPIPNGISKDLVDQLSPKVKFKKVKESSDSVCTICLEDFKNPDLVRQLNCGHVFHARCIEEWFERNKFCCLCKRDCSKLALLDVTSELDLMNNSNV